jgi:hypothetical protein
MTDYCDTTDELTKNPQAKEWMKAIARGNDAAFEFMWRFWNFEHCFDDLVDRDKPVSQEDAAKALLQFVECLLFNPFVQVHKQSLFPMLVSVVNRWVDGTEWLSSNDPLKKSQATVIACGDIDLIALVAYLTGGWDHLRRMKGLRTYDNNTTEPAKE